MLKTSRLNEAVPPTGPLSAKMGLTKAKIASQ